MSTPAPEPPLPTKDSNMTPTNMDNPNALSNTDKNGSPPRNPSTTGTLTSDRKLKGVTNPYTIKKSNAPKIRYTDINMILTAVKECISF